MATIKELKTLALHATKGTVPASTEFEAFTNEDIKEALYAEVRELTKDLNSFRRNKNTIFEILEEIDQQIVPKKVLEDIGVFAEVKTTDWGVKYIWKRRLGRNRAKTFLTVAAASGVYETFRLDSESFTVSTQTFGIGAYVDFLRYLRGEEDISEYGAVIAEAMSEKIFTEVYKALMDAISAVDRPAANKVSLTTFDVAEMRKLVNAVKAYGTGAVIFATPEFIATMDVTAYVGGDSPVHSAQDIADMRQYGRIFMFYGTPIVEMRQSFTDETNTTKVLSPQYAFVFPTGGEKVAKVQLEGTPVYKQFDNRDNSMEIQAFRSIGVGILTHHNWGVYRNSALT